MSVFMRRVPVVLVALLGLALIGGAGTYGGAAAGSEDRSAGDGPRGYTFAVDGVFPSRQAGLKERPDAGVVTGAAILGADERVRITDTSEYPWRAIAWLGLYDEDEHLMGHCTGTFIGPDTILTAAHCLWDSDTETWTHDIAVAPGKDGDYEPYGYEWATNWWVPDGYIDSGGSKLWDWGVIKLPSNVLGLEVGWLQVAQMTTATLSRPDFMPAIVGYPGDKEGWEEWTMWGGIKDEFVEVGDYDLYHDIDTFAGQSGSAIFSANTADEDILGLIVGVHTTGGSSYNRGSRIDAELMDDILEGCRVMMCTIAWLVEAGAGAAPSPSPTPTKTPSPTPTVPATAPVLKYRAFAPEIGKQR